MAGTTKIGWTDATWNPSVGCTRVSDGCDHCYAFDEHDRRFAANARTAVAEGFTRTEFGDEFVSKARAAGVKMPLLAVQYDRPFSVVQLKPTRLDLPLHWPEPRRIFVDSISDLFHSDVPTEYIAKVWRTMHRANWHLHQVLTKRPERALELLMPGGPIQTLAEIDVWPLPNVHIGTSVENQAAARARVPIVVQISAAVTFLSAEPLLGPIDLTDAGMWVPCPDCGGSMSIPVVGGGTACPRCLVPYQGQVPGVGWVIAGGESGRFARPMDIAWPRDLQRQCREAAIPFFMKQVGTHPYEQHQSSDYCGSPHITDPDAICDGRHRLSVTGPDGIERSLLGKGGRAHHDNPDEWPADLRVQEFPSMLPAKAG